MVQLSGNQQPTTKDQYKLITPSPITDHPIFSYLASSSRSSSDPDHVLLSNLSMNFFLELSAISCQLSEFDFFDLETWDYPLISHPIPPLKHPTLTLTLTPTLNWGGKDIILPNLSQMFLEKITPLKRPN
jgi:hypothetical protein